MEVEICAVGGYSEVGKNMTAIRIDDDVIIADIGLFLEPLVVAQTGEEQQPQSAMHLMKIGAIPDDSVLEKWRSKVRAIVLGHAHLDHIGAVQYIAAKYRAPIMGSPYAVAILRSLLQDNEVRLPNPIKAIPFTKEIQVSTNIRIELINITHSTLHCSIVAIHTPKGIILYATDFKLDNTPVLGPKPNYKRLQEIAGNVKLLIVECLYSGKEAKTPSEIVAREMLQDIMLNMKNQGNAIFVTTFASHLPRIKSIIDFGNKLKRRVVILGRSMGRYINAAENLNLVQFSQGAKIVPFSGDVRRVLEEVNRNRGKYVVVCTGNQAEPGSILDKILNKKLNFHFKEDDQVIFSCKTLPVPSNILNREAMEKKLKDMKVRIFTDVHSSGHSSKEDLREFIELLRPEHIVPCHGNRAMELSFEKLSTELGYVTGKNVHLLEDGAKQIFRF